MGLDDANIPPKANAPSEWATEVQCRVMNHDAVKQRGQSGSARVFIDGQWKFWQTEGTDDMTDWGTEGTDDMTDLRIAQKPINKGESLQDAFMLNGGSYRPPLTGKTDKQIVVKDANSNLCTFHDVLREPHNHLRAKPGCWKVIDKGNDSEQVGLGWSVLFVPCPADQDSVEIALQTNYYQATSEKNPNKVWCVNYGSGPMIAAGSTPGGYQFHMNRNEAGKPCYVKVRVSNIEASDRLGELSEMSLANRQTAVAEKLTNAGDIITLCQVPFMPDDQRPLESNYIDPLAVSEESDSAVYRSLSAGALTVELESGSEIAMDEEHSNLPHIKDPMFYVDGGHRRAAGMPRIDKIKVIAVKGGEVTDEIITMASDWLHERNAGQMLPLEHVAAVQIAQQNVLPNSAKYEQYLNLNRNTRPAADENETPPAKLLKSETRPVDN